MYFETKVEKSAATKVASPTPARHRSHWSPLYQATYTDWKYQEHRGRPKLPTASFHNHHCQSSTSSAVADRRARWNQLHSWAWSESGGVHPRIAIGYDWTCTRSDVRRGFRRRALMLGPRVRSKCWRPRRFRRTAWGCRPSCRPRPIGL